MLLSLSPLLVQRRALTPFYSCCYGVFTLIQNVHRQRPGLLMVIKECCLLNGNNHRASRLTVCASGIRTVAAVTSEISAAAILKHNRTLEGKPWQR
jgi:hypothetical protein